MATDCTDIPASYALLVDFITPFLLSYSLRYLYKYSEKNTSGLVPVLDTFEA